MRYVICLLMLALTACATPALETRDDLQSVFHEQGVENGTFVLLDVEHNHMTVINSTRAAQRFWPASTFKIANSLIALETGAVRSEQEVIPYGGQPQPFEVWEQDMPLAEAIRVSNVPVYQEVARRIGLSRMQHWVKRLDYGNQNIGSVIDRFWLDGPLEISAIEQARFLARLTKSTFPVSQTVQETVRDMLKLEKFGDMQLYGKTGWAMGATPDIGWLVGWVEKEGHIYTFALNMEMPEETDVAKRIPIVKVLLGLLIP